MGQRVDLYSPETVANNEKRTKYTKTNYLQNNHYLSFIKIAENAMKEVGPPTCGHCSSHTKPSQPGAQSHPFRLKLQSAPLRHESQVSSQSSPNVPGRHSVATKEIISNDTKKHNIDVLNSVNCLNATDNFVSSTITFSLTFVQLTGFIVFQCAANAVHWTDNNSARFSLNTSAEYNIHC